MVSPRLARGDEKTPEEGTRPIRWAAGANPQRKGFEGFTWCNELPHQSPFTGQRRKEVKGDYSNDLRGSFYTLRREKR